MAEILYLMAHCSATPEGRDIQPYHIQQMHQGPCDTPHGVRYRGKLYANRQALPADVLGGVPIHLLHGRGWNQVGYRHLIPLTGGIRDLIQYNDDAILQASEITNGAAGWNGKTIHYCYAGGVDDNLQPKDTRTDWQKQMEFALVMTYIQLYPHIKLIGHNQVAAKACPSYDVPTWARSVGIPEKNIESRRFL